MPVPRPSASQTGAAGIAAYVLAVFTDDKWRRSDAATLARATTTSESEVHRDPCGAITGHDVVVVERVHRDARPLLRKAAQAELASWPLASAFGLACLRRRCWTGVFAGPVQRDTSLVADGSAPVMERFRFVRYEPRPDTPRHVYDIDVNHSKRDPIPRMVNPSRSNHLKDRRVVQSIVKCVSNDLDAPCVADTEALSPKYLRKVAEAAREALVDARDKRCLVLGGGAGCLAHHLVATSAATTVVNVEYEPRIVAVGHDHLGLPNTDRVQAGSSVTTRVADALEYARQHPEEHGKYDVVVVDVFSGDTAPLEYRLPFFSDVRRLVKPDGGKVLVHTPFPRLARRIDGALASTFGATNVTESPARKGTVFAARVT